MYMNIQDSMPPSSIINFEYDWPIQSVSKELSVM